MSEPPAPPSRPTPTPAAPSAGAGSRPAAPTTPPAPSPAAPSPLLARALHAHETLLWSGSPRTGIAPGDGEAALVGAVLVFATLATASTALGWEQQLGVARAGLAACVFGLAIAFGRSTTSGVSLTLGIALLAPMLALAFAKAGLAAASALLCPLGSLSFLVLWSLRRWLGRRGLRYHLSSERGFIEREGRFLVAFEFEGPPEVAASRLARGAIGTVRFIAAHGRLTTREGTFFPVPAPQCRFVRVEAPWEVVDAWERRSL